MHNFYRGNKQPKDLGYFCNCIKLPKSKQWPNRRKFAQSGHPDVQRSRVLRLNGSSKKEMNWECYLLQMTNRHPRISSAWGHFPTNGSAQGRYRSTGGASKDSEAESIPTASLFLVQNLTYFWSPNSIAPFPTLEKKMIKTLIGMCKYDSGFKQNRALRCRAVSVKYYSKNVR
jgi:hypothetical protein